MAQYAPLDIPQDPYPMIAQAKGAQSLETMTRAMLRSIGQQPSALSAAFFSPGNVDEIQRRLADIVLRRTRHRIDRQSDEQLLVIMRHVFVTYAKFSKDVPSEVRRLNDVVLAEVVPQVGAGLAQYLAYVRDASSLPDPLPRGQYTSTKGTRTTELFRGL